MSRPAPLTAKVIVFLLLVPLLLTVGLLWVTMWLVFAVFYVLIFLPLSLIGPTKGGDAMRKDRDL